MTGSNGRPPGLLARLQRRGVLRVAASYAVIAWLLLQIADVVLEPLGAPGWVLQALIVAVAVGFPVAVVLAWFYELTPDGIQLDRAEAGAERPNVPVSKTGVPHGTAGSNPALSASVSELDQRRSNSEALRCCRIGPAPVQCTLSAGPGIMGVRLEKYSRTPSGFM